MPRMGQYRKERRKRSGKNDLRESCRNKQEKNFPFCVGSKLAPFPLDAQSCREQPRPVVRSNLPLLRRGSGLELVRTIHSGSRTVF